MADYPYAEIRVRVQDNHTDKDFLFGSFESILAPLRNETLFRFGKRNDVYYIRIFANSTAEELTEKLLERMDIFYTIHTQCPNLLFTQPTETEQK